MPDSTTMEMFRVLAQQSQHVANMIEMQSRLVIGLAYTEGIPTTETVSLKESIQEESEKVTELTRKAKALYQGN